MMISMFLSLMFQPAEVGPRSYELCVATVEEDARSGLDFAEAWSAEGGGNPAKHCRAIALLAAGRPAVAGGVLAELADAEVFDPGVATRLYLQSAEAFMAGGRRDEAYAALRKAYEKAPDTPEVHLAAAAIYATGGEWEGVILTINALERFAELSADAYALRGRAYFEKEELGQAAREVSRALSLDPYLVDAIVLRGDLLTRGVSLPIDPYAAP